MSKRKISVEDKIYAVHLYLDGKGSLRQIASLFVHIKGKQEIFQRIEVTGSFGLFSMPWFAG